MNKKTGIVLAAALLLSLALAGSALADPTWIISVNEAVAIQEDGTVGPPDLQGLARPTFMRLDAKRKEVTLLAPPERSGEVTKIDSMVKGDGVHVFSGVEAGRAWSMVISDSGHMTLSVATDGAVWSVFGHAMLEK